MKNLITEEETVFNLKQKTILKLLQIENEHPVSVKFDKVILVFFRDVDLFNVHGEK